MYSKQAKSASSSDYLSSKITANKTQEMTIRNTAKRLVLAPFSAVFSQPRAKGQIALTFDDGPDPEFTLQVSGALKTAGAKATFFLVGENMRRFPEIVHQLHRDGHELGSHSLSHPEIKGLPSRCLPDQVEAMYLMKLPDGSPAISNRYFRPPKGVISPVLVAFCWRRNIRLVFWNRDPEDYKADSAQQILDYFKTQPPRSGDIILLHDNSPHIVGALPKLLALLQSMKLQPVTVSELIGTRSISASDAAN